MVVDQIFELSWPQAATIGTAQQHRTVADSGALGTLNAGDRLTADWQFQAQGCGAAFDHLQVGGSRAQWFPGSSRTLYAKVKLLTTQVLFAIAILLHRKDKRYFGSTFLGRFQRFKSRAWARF